MAISPGDLPLHSLPQSLHADRVRSGRQIWATGAIVAVFLLGLAINRTLVASAWGEIRTLSASAVLVLVAAAGVHRIVQSVMVVVCTGTAVGNLPIRRAFAANEVHVGCSNAVVGGGAIGTGMKVAMLRSWGVDGTRIATSIAATSVIPLIIQWLVTAAAAGWFLLRGDGSLGNWAAFTGGVVLSIGPILFWLTVLRSPTVVSWIASLVARTQQFAVRIPMPQRLRKVVGELDVTTEAERIRASAQPLLGKRGLAAVSLALLGQLTIGSILIVTLHGLGTTADAYLHPVEMLATLALARTLGSFAPLPGGLLLFDAGLLAALTGRGVERPSALAALGLYRAATFLVPMLTGLLAMMIWAHQRRKQPMLQTRTCRPDLKAPTC